MLNQFFSLPTHINKTHILLKDQEARHAAKVLRKGVGETIFITDGAGCRYSGEIESISKKHVSVAILEKEEFLKKSPAIVLVLGMIKKKDRMEFAVEKATELGASEIILFRGDHSEKFGLRTDRLEAAVISAMKQSLRVYLPELKTVASLEPVISVQESNTVILHADQDASKSEFELPESSERILMVVGPEGGLSAREKGLLKQYGATGVQLGDYRLRAETAAIVMVSRYGNNSAEARR